ncbi:hypothetical protein RAB80_008129 [Fusarium oxysporum f. sp. vasinfectum]|nr:hypothetical protein RAB80_008129 [Fusarium oxysporum f. sp. vasinfectum]
MGKKSTKAAAPKNDAASAPPPGQLMDLVENFLSDHSFKGAADAFKKQREKKGWKATAATDEEGQEAEARRFLELLQRLFFLIQRILRLKRFLRF